MVACAHDHGRSSEARAHHLLLGAFMGSFALHAAAAAWLPGWALPVPAKELAPLTVQLALSSPQQVLAAESAAPPQRPTTAQHAAPAALPRSPVAARQLPILHKPLAAHPTERTTHEPAPSPDTRLATLTHTNELPVESHEAELPSATPPLQPSPAFAPIPTEGSAAGKPQDPGLEQGALASAAPTAAGEAAGEAPHRDVGYLYNPRPDYPVAARRLHLQGNVLLRVHVDAAGQPQEITLAQSSGVALLDDAALEKVRSWRFTPAKQGDTAIAHWVDIPIRFRLED